jgi:hypothetical protein
MWRRDYWVDLLSEAVGQYFDGSMPDGRKTSIRRARKYREGFQPKRLRVKPPASDDNIVVNFSGLVVERAVSMLFGEGVEFDLPGEDETEADRWLKLTWELNKKYELLNDLADYGATSGTPVVLFDAESILHDGTLYPELSCLDPSYLEIKTDPDNYKKVLYYEIKYQIPLEGQRTEWRRRLIEPVMAMTDAGVAMPSSWEVSNWRMVGNRWEQIGSTQTWDFPWPPILVWKNLPNAGSPYGRPDLTDDVLDVQDAINLVASNINKVMRLQAHQRLWGRFLGGVKKAIKKVVNGKEETENSEGVEVIDFGPDKVLNTNNEKGHLEAIQANAGFSDMTIFLHELRDALFAIARSTDPHSLKDKVGQITNFGLRILYKDAIDKLNTKRQLYGEALLEINRRLLELGAQESDPGLIKWPETMPVDEKETQAGQKFELDAGLTSKQTIREERGRDNDIEKERLAAEAQDSAETDDNVGARLLRNFNRGTRSE